MSEETNEIKYFEGKYLERDIYLNTIIALIEHKNIQLEVGITLNVGGAIISGIAISRKKYLEGIVNAVAGDDSDVAQLFGEIYGNFLEMEEDSEEETAAPPDYNFIHLKNVQIFGVNQEPISLNDNYWRGKLSAVDGYMIGNMAL